MYCYICVLIGPSNHALRTYTTTSVRSYDYISVLILVYIGPTVLIGPLYLCPHKASYHYMCPHRPWYICVRIGRRATI
jgi:hypothetical protein